MFVNSNDSAMAIRLFGREAVREVKNSKTGTWLTTFGGGCGEPRTYIVLIYQAGGCGDSEVIYSFEYDPSAVAREIRWKANGLEVLAYYRSRLNGFLRDKATWARQMYDAVITSDHQIVYVREGGKHGVVVVLEPRYCGEASIMHIVPLTEYAYYTQGRETGKKSLKLMLEAGELYAYPSFVRERAKWVVEQVEALEALDERYQALVQFDQIAEALKPVRRAVVGVQMVVNIPAGEFTFNDENDLSDLLEEFFVS